MTQQEINDLWLECYSERYAICITNNVSELRSEELAINYADKVCGIEEGK